MTILSFFVIQRALTFFKIVDPSQIILDEVVGCFLTFVGLAFSWQSLLAGFLLFRLFDIFKPFGIKRLEQLPGAWGVLLDDCAAGLLANIILRIFLPY